MSIEENPPKLLEDLLQAYYDARRSKRSKPAQLVFEKDLEHNIIVLYEEIRDRTYRPSPGTCFVTKFPVRREIYASCFRDRVVHHLLFNYINPIFNRRMIHDCYSCRIGKGTLFGIDRLEHHIRSCSQNFTKPAYILKLDLRGYFMSIKKAKLYEILCRVLDKWQASPKADPMFDRDLVDFLIKQILFRDPTENCNIVGSPSDWDGLPPSKSLLKSPKGVGLPIGDLTSQLFNNIYLTEFDNFVKRDLKCKYYGRYVDDFFVVHSDRGYLERIVPIMRDYLHDNLGLTMHPNKIILRDCKDGITFLGAFIRPYRRLPTKRCISAFHHSMNKVEKKVPQIDSFKEIHDMLSTVNSYCGYFRHLKAYRMLKARFRGSPMREYLYFESSPIVARIKKRHKEKYEIEK